MKRLYYLAVALMLIASCKVVDPYEPNPMTDRNISNLSYSLFYEESLECISLFYNAYHIAHFLDADAEVKVSPEYDLIRIGLMKNQNSYIYDYDDYIFSSEGFLNKGGSCHVEINYHKSLNIKCLDADKWQISNNRGMVFGVEVLKEDEKSMTMAVTLKGSVTEDSEYVAKMEDEGLKVFLEQKAIGEFDTMSWDGNVLVTYYEDESLIKSCRMTFKPGLTTEFDVF